MPLEMGSLREVCGVQGPNLAGCCFEVAQADWPHEACGYRPDVLYAPYRAHGRLCAECLDVSPRIPGSRIDDRGKVCV
jgi:hypothetical protein